jgi:hypothetical protein
MASHNSKALSFRGWKFRQSHEVWVGLLSQLQWLPFKFGGKMNYAGSPGCCNGAVGDGDAMVLDLEEITLSTYLYEDLVLNRSFPARSFQSRIVHYSIDWFEYHRVA